jgi:hypothetical protein
VEAKLFVPVDGRGMVRWGLSTATAEPGLKGNGRGENSKLESDVVRVQAWYDRVARQLASGARGGLNRATTTPPRQIYGAGSAVRVAEEKGSRSAWSVLAPGETRLTASATWSTGAKVHLTAEQRQRLHRGVRQDVG